MFYMVIAKLILGTRRRGLITTLKIRKSVRVLIKIFRNVIGATRIASDITMVTTVVTDILFGSKTTIVR